MASMNYFDPNMFNSSNMIVHWRKTAVYVYWCRKSHLKFMASTLSNFTNLPQSCDVYFQMFKCFQKGKVLRSIDFNGGKIILVCKDGKLLNILMFVCATTLYQYMKSYRNYVFNLSDNIHVRIKIYP